MWRMGRWRRGATRRASTVIVAVFAILAVALPIALAVAVAHRQGLDGERTRVRSYAQDVVQRSDDTADQIAAGIGRLVEASRAAPPCSPRVISVMRDIALGSTYIQAIGHVSGDDLECSSLRGGLGSLPLGPVDEVSPSKTKIRNNVVFEAAGSAEHFVVEQAGFAGVVHKDVPIDVTTKLGDVSLATFSTVNGHLLAQRGNVDPRWVDRLGDATERTFVDHGELVTVLRSSKYFIGAVAAIPTAHVDDRTKGAAALLVPFGIVAGGILAAAVVFLARLQLALPSVLRSALRRGEFFVEYQPLVDLQSGRWRGAEALVRWRRPSGEMIRPDVFIPVVEENGLSQAFTQHVIGLIARDTAGMFAANADFHIAINLTPDDLHSPATVAVLQQLLAETGAMPSNFTVEATERGFLRPAEARPVVEALRAIGISVAIDDFGTGYSSLSYLEQFEIDYLKIDKAFVDTLGTDAATSQVIFHVIEMAKALNLELIAEGVETEPQADRLRGAGVQYAQGWLYARSLSIDDLRAGLTAQPIPV